MNEELLEAIGADMLGLLVGTVADVWHEELTLEATPHSVINTLRFTPVGLQSVNTPPVCSINVTKFITSTMFMKMVR